jgi:cytochrome c-type biogenesis protein CcmH/NrfG
VIACARRSLRHRFAKAKFALAKRHFRRNEVEECIACMLEGLKVSPSRSDEWFLVGLAAMRVNKLELAMKAFTRVLQVDGDRSDAWANLGSIALHCGQNDRALNALTQVHAGSCTACSRSDVEIDARMCC